MIRFASTGPEGGIEILIDPALLRTRVRDGALVVSVEGYGRFRLLLP
jgi:hypothetical protein